LTLDRVQAKSRIFLDSTIFIYHAVGSSPQCRALLERCEAGDLAGVTSVVVLAEVAHRLMLMEAVSAGLVSTTNAVKKLGARPDVVRRLHGYQQMIDGIPLMGVDVLALDVGTMLRSADVRRQHGLLVNDSLVVASALSAGVTQLASADAGFDRVTELALFRPGDLA
jgi:predicted nucleic acid-binding protein